MKQGERSYVCPSCSVALTVSNEREPVVMIEGLRGGPTVRVVSVMGVEVHRCVVPGVPL